MYFKRKIYQEILKWKKEYSDKYALFLKGARRVGKTTLAKTIGEEEFNTYIIIDFSKTPEEIKKLFKESLLNLDYLYSKIQSYYQTILYPGKSLLILDEIQLCPFARQSIKTLIEDGRYSIIETGSLASITKNNEKILIPSEEYTLSIYPFDFEEFLWALGDEVSMKFIRQSFEEFLPLGDSVNKKYMTRFREYMLVGGMPQAIKAYVKNKNFQSVDVVKQHILNLYENDINQQKVENVDYIQSILRIIPSELSKHDKKFIVSHAQKHARLRGYQGPFKWLNEAMITSPAYNVTDPSAAFALSQDESSFKCYMGDTGLLVSLAFNGRPFIDNTLYNDILFDKLHVNEGMIVENVIAQIFKSRGDSLLFYSKRNEKTKKPLMEIDFLLRRKRKIIPIEVKSSKSTKHASLIKFKNQFSNKIGQQYILYNGDIKRDGEIIYLPMYFATVI